MIVALKYKKMIKISLCGLAAGVINGLLGTGGGMVLVPLLTGITDLEEEQVFPASVSIILPICIVSVCISACQMQLPFRVAWPYLTGSVFGGVLAGVTGKKIPVKWLHRGLGLLILWGGVRYLC